MKLDKFIHVKIASALLARAKKKAKSLGMTVSGMIRYAVKKTFKLDL